MYILIKIHDIIKINMMDIVKDRFICILIIYTHWLSNGTHGSNVYFWMAIIYFCYRVSIIDSSWWPDEARGEDVSNHDIDIFVQESSRLCSRKFNICRTWKLILWHPVFSWMQVKCKIFSWSLEIYVWEKMLSLIQDLKNNISWLADQWWCMIITYHEVCDL